MLRRENCVPVPCAPARSRRRSCRSGACLRGCGLLGAFRLTALSRFVAILLHQVMRGVHVVDADALLQARGCARLQAVDAHVGDFLLLISVHAQEIGGDALDDGNAVVLAQVCGGVEPWHAHAPPPGWPGTARAPAPRKTSSCAPACGGVGEPVTLETMTVTLSWPPAAIASLTSCDAQRWGRARVMTASICSSSIMDDRPSSTSRRSPVSTLICTYRGRVLGSRA